MKLTVGEAQVYSHPRIGIEPILQAAVKLKYGCAALIVRDLGVGDPHWSEPHTQRLGQCFFRCEPIREAGNRIATALTPHLFGGGEQTIHQWLPTALQGLTHSREIGNVDADAEYQTACATIRLARILHQGPRILAEFAAVLAPLWAKRGAVIQ